MNQSLNNNTSEQSRRDSESFKEKSVAQDMKGEEIGKSESNTWSVFMKERSMSMNASLSPVFLSSVRKSPKTEGHPNALKNIRNYALLQASIIDMIHRNEGNEIGPLRKSFSALDFRLPPDKLSSLYSQFRN
ncbi:hypothetical protein VIGAN_01078200 [Vigna angularis var. angularis]|uniref:Uncharacterized protein n=1 Tax=Vigna angularis var. angularis TaxID=157739 RepID=A0A0S3QY90_PHAAN|nr:uncharacterized protein LOC108320901 [Vigna angularis]BAT73309.1 hypothetical protein VIGAN_01078200 [Vigna angularis var. angularis]